MAKMKISMLSVFYPFRGGIAQFSTALKDALDEKHEVQAINFKRQYPDFLFPGKSQYVDEFVSKETNQVLDSINPISALQIAKQINRFSPDVFLSNYWMSFFGPIMGLVAKKVKSSKLKIALIHNIIPHEKRFFDSFANKFFLKQHDGFIVLSEAVKNDLKPLVHNKPICVIPHPIYSHFGEKIPKDLARKKLSISEDKKVLLFFGLIREYKGLDLLLEAMSLLSNEYLLLVAGECYGSFANYQAIIDKNQISSKVKCQLHFIEDSEVPYYFSASDLCVLPYKHATQSGVIAVADHFDLPCLATHVGGLHEHISHLKTGYIVHQATPTELTKGINQAFEKNQLINWSSAIFNKKTENSWSNFAEKLIHFTKEVSDNKATKQTTKK